MTENPPTDDEYLAAVQAGDLAAAQRMVAEAAKAAGFAVGPVYHGSEEEEFSVFEVQKTSDGFFFAPDQQTAEFYGPSRKFFLHIKSLADFDDCLVFDQVAREAIWDLEERRDSDLVKAEVMDIKETPESRRFVADVLGITDEQLREYETWDQALGDIDADGSDFKEALEDVPKFKAHLDQAAPVRSEAVGHAAAAYGSQEFYMQYQDDFLRAARHLGHDGVYLMDPAGSTGGSSESYVVFDACQIKSADAVVRDDSGNLVPLSKRFDTESKDVRGSVPEPPLLAEAVQTAPSETLRHELRC